MYGLLKKKVIAERISLISTGWAMLVLQALSLMHISQVSSQYTLERGQILCFFTGTEYFALSQCSNLGPRVFWWLFQEFFTQTTQLYWQFSLPSPAPSYPLQKNPSFPHSKPHCQLVMHCSASGWPKNKSEANLTNLPWNCEISEKNSSWGQFQHCTHRPATVFKSSFRTTQR